MPGTSTRATPTTTSRPSSAPSTTRPPSTRPTPAWRSRTSSPSSSRYSRRPRRRRCRPAPSRWRPDASGQSRQSVDAHGVVVGPVGHELGGGLHGRPAVEVVALGVEGQARDGVAAGVGDPVDLDHDHGAGAVLGREELDQVGEPGVAWEHGQAPAVDPHDARWTVEGAAHDRDPAVLPEMGDGLGAATCQVEVCDAPRAEDGESARHALGRDVDVTVLPDRRGGHEEDGLGRQPAGEPVVDSFMDTPHGRTLGARAVYVPSSSMGPGGPCLTYHSQPYTAANCSRPTWRADVVSGIWLAWAAMATRLRSSTPVTSTVVLTNTVGVPM